VLKLFLGSKKKSKLNQIVLGNGSDEVLICFFSFCEPKVDNVITTNYGMYGVLANINAVENREILLSQDFQPQIDNILHEYKNVFFVHQTIQQEFIYDEI
jgi:histidinol-phosphate aminotransferase